MRLFAEKAKKEALKLSFAVVVAECLMVGGFHYGVKYGIFDYFKPKTIYINNAYAKTNETRIETSEVIEPEIPKNTKTGTFYTYNAEPEQTDGNPYRTASGRIVKDGIVANNCLPFGSRILVDGIGELEVQDRMNSRYDCDDFDVFRENPNQNFKKTLKYTILN